MSMPDALPTFPGSRGGQEEGQAGRQVVSTPAGWTSQAGRALAGLKEWPTSELLTEPRGSAH